MSQIEIEEETVWIPDTSNISIQSFFPEEYIYISLLIFSLMYSIRLLKS